MEGWGGNLPVNRIRSAGAKFLLGLAALVVASALFTAISAKDEPSRIELRPITAAGDAGLGSAATTTPGPDGQPLPVGFFGGQALQPVGTEPVSHPNHIMRAVNFLDGGRGTLYAYPSGDGEILAVKIREDTRVGYGLFLQVSADPTE